MSGRLSRVATCIRRVANTARLPRNGMVDAARFSTDMLSAEMSEKYSALVRRIRNLDGVDMRDYGRKFKHFIFTDLRDGAYGGKAIAAYLIRAGFTFALGPRGFNGTGPDRFALLQSQPLWRKPITVGLKRTILDTYNKRPENVHGDLLRILVLDSKYKEGIDLFDVKYCHIMEEPLAESDMKQAIGRATRFCGQKGLPFVEGVGWTLNVFVYRTVVPGVPPFVKDGDGMVQSIDAHSLVMKHSGLDLSLLVLTKEITELAIRAAADRSLTREINPQRHHGSQAGGGTFAEEFGRYAWPTQTLRNACDLGVVAPGTAVRFTPTQQFVRHFLTPESPYKGLLAWHSVGTGKTCTAVATASGAFMSAGYRILWVTRNSLMSDVWKNVFESVCYMPFRRLGLENRRVESMSDVSPLFMKPISYKMFQNALEKKNDLGRTLYRANGPDMLRRTFLIIDEVHKLHDGDLLATEKADFNVIQQYIWNSYQVSGADSVRPLLMTATPIGDTPASLFDILNTLIPKAESRLIGLPAFRRSFVDLTGHVSADGARYFSTRVTGLISYLNRERDPTTFAIPTIRTVTVGLGDIDTPDVRAVARRCLPVIKAAPGKTKKKARRGCYLAVKNEYTLKSKGTQRKQLAECFGARAASNLSPFPSYNDFIGELEGLGETVSVNSGNTGDAVINRA